LPVVTSFYRLSASQDESNPAPEPAAESDIPICDDPDTVHNLMLDPEPACDPVAWDDKNPEAVSSNIASFQAVGIDPLQLGQTEAPPAPQPVNQSHTISHYVLLPLYAWGAADWELDVIQPLLQETHPTVGFSLTEARLAARVTVVGGAGAISAEALDMLRASGCKVERVMDDGTLIAS
jgi:hypothetical protein